MKLDSNGMATLTYIIIINARNWGYGITSIDCVIEMPGYSKTPTACRLRLILGLMLVDELTVANCISERLRADMRRLRYNSALILMTVLR